MPTHVALLRGVNLGKRRVSMAELKKRLEGLGYTDVSTYVQSGNAVLTSKTNESRIAAELEAELTKAFGFAVPVIVRSRAGLADVVRNNPFPDAAADPTKLHVRSSGSHSIRHGSDTSRTSTSRPRSSRRANARSTCRYPTAWGARSSQGRWRRPCAARARRETGAPSLRCSTW